MSAGSTESYTGNLRHISTPKPGFEPEPVEMFRVWWGVDNPATYRLRDRERPLVSERHKAALFHSLEHALRAAPLGGLCAEEGRKREGV